LRAVEDSEGVYILERCEGFEELYVFTFCKTVPYIKQALCARLLVLGINQDATITMNVNLLLYFTYDPSNIIEHPTTEYGSLYALSEYMTQLATNFSHRCAIMSYLRDQRRSGDVADTMSNSGIVPDGSGDQR